MSSSPTRFDPVIRAVTRKAESLYTKMGIRRDESEDLTRKKKNDGAMTDDSPLWDDNTTVSIVALRNFLEDLLGTGHESPLPAPAAPGNTLQTPSTSHPNSSAAAHAAHAYRSTGKVVHDKNINATTVPLPETVAASSPDSVRLGGDFGDGERAEMEDHIRRMKELEARGVETLTLRRNLTFLEGIRLAIDDAS